MGFKDQVAEAKELAKELVQQGLTLDEVRTILNKQLEGFYYLSGKRIYLAHIQDYLPAVRIS